MKPQIYIDALFAIKKADKQYEEINKLLHRKDDNFHSLVALTDLDLLKNLIWVLNDAFFEMTGFNEIATYYLYENRGVRRYIRDVNGKYYEWAKDKEFEKSVYEMIKNHQARKRKKNASNL